MQQALREIRLPPLTAGTTETLCRFRFDWAGIAPALGCLKTAISLPDAKPNQTYASQRFRDVHNGCHCPRRQSTLVTPHQRELFKIR
jgi:hypothetical protein